MGTALRFPSELPEVRLYFPTIKRSCGSLKKASQSILKARLGRYRGARRGYLIVQCQAIGRDLGAIAVDQASKLRSPALHDGVAEIYRQLRLSFAVVAMDLPMVPAITWDEIRFPLVHAARRGDILITLDVNNVAETSFWTGRRPHGFTAIRGAWIVAVETIPSSEEGSAGLDAAWAMAEFRVLSVYEEAEGGSWTSCDTAPCRISSLLAPRGLGNGETPVPSEENIFVVVYPNNFPVSAPILQARWWDSGYESRFVPNSWIMGIVDVPRIGGTLSRTLSCWVCTRDRVWTRDGTPQSCIIRAARLHPFDRIEFEILAAGPIVTGTATSVDTGGISSRPTVDTVPPSPEEV